MSFSSEVKQELIRVSLGQPDCCAQAQLYGLLLLGHEFSRRGVRLRTESQALAQYGAAQLHEIELATAQVRRSGRKWEVTMREAERGRVLERFGHGENELSLHIVRENLTCENCRTAFLRGAFLSCATVSDPQQQYHLEFTVASKRLAGALCALLEEAGLPPKLCQRKGVWLLYYKDSGQIEDVLALLGAQLAMLGLVNIKIEKDMRNNVNRLVNFEMANMGRSSAAAAAQLRAVARLRAGPGLESLTPPLREAALLREENPEASLQELCDLASQPVTRSGMNHRLKKLEALAAENPP